MTALRATQSESIFDVTLPPSPYPGLRPFMPSEWPIFFGRERMADEVITRLVKQGFVVVHGDSGSGKSSLIYAGVLPALAQQAARGGLRWLTCHATPGDDPILNLARSLAALHGREGYEDRVFELQRAISFGRDGPATLAGLVAPSSEDHVCILVDQFEEIFAHARRHGPDDARVCIEFLIALQERKAKGLYAILTMRSEFLGACAQFAGFAQAVNQTQYLLPSMDHDDLMRAIREPATLYRGEIQRELAERLIDDAGGTQDQLPLIQHGLMALHRSHVPRQKPPSDTASTPTQRWQLTLEHYTSGRKDLAGLLSARADEVADGVDSASSGTHRTLVEDLFRALTEINAEGQAIRRSQTLGQLMAVTNADSDSVQRAIDAFRTEGVSFLRPYDMQPLSIKDRVDISHEALIRCWRRIADPVDGWLIQEFRDGLIWRSLLVQADSFEKDRTSLLSAATTEERLTWLERHNPAWCERYGGGWDRVISVIKASVDAIHREQERAAREEQEDQLREQEEQQRRAEVKERRLQQEAAEALAREKVRRASSLRKALYLALAFAIAAVAFGIVGWTERLKATAAAKEETRQRQLAQASERGLRVENEKTRQALAEADRKASQLGEYEKQVQTLQAQLARAIAETPQDSALRTQLTRAQQTVDQQARIVSGGTRLAPRIYVQISDQSQRAAARELVTRISAFKVGDDPLFVPGVELKSTDRNVFRCFRASECKTEATPLLDRINDQLKSPQLVLEDLSKQYGDSNSVRRRHYEIWFAPGDIALANGGASVPVPAEAPAAKAMSTQIPDLRASASALVFAPQEMGTLPHEEHLQITNTSDSTWTLLFELAEGDAKYFSLRGCERVEKRGSCDLTVRYTPSATGMFMATVLASATSQEGVSGTLAPILLDGSTFEPAWRLVAKSSDAEDDATDASSVSITFLGGDTRNRRIQLINTLDRPIALRSAHLDLEDFKNGFRVDDKCSGRILKARDRCQIEVKFKPTSADPSNRYSDVITFYEDGKDDPTVSRRAEIHLRGTFGNTWLRRPIRVGG